MSRVDPAWRPISEADLSALGELIRLVETHDDLGEVTTDARLLHDFGNDVEDPATDTGITYDGETAIAFYWVSKNRGGLRKHRAILSFMIHPAYRTDAQADETMKHGIARCTEILEELPDDIPRLIRCWNEDTATHRVPIFERHGFVPARFFVTMKRPLSQPVPAVGSPAGVDIVTWRADMDDAIRLVHNSAFADHWGSEPMGAEAWSGYFSGDPNFLPEMSYVAMDGAEIAGYALNAAFPDDFAMLGHSEAWTEALGVLAGWRRKGVASALLRASLKAFQDAGYEYGALGVDTDSPTGAVDLYESVGYERRQSSTTFVRHV